VFALCHCSRCRKSTGSAHASNIFTDPGNITWHTGQSLVRRFELPSAERFSKCFCSECGSPVPSLSRDGKRLLIPAGSLNSDPGVRPHARIFLASRAAWYENLDSVRSFDGSLL
jgi:hypothetical protein